MLTYDPYDPEWLEAGVPFDVLARIRQEEPVCRTPAGAYYVARRADIEAVLRDVETFRTDLAPITGMESVDDVPDEQLFLSEIVEPRHGQVRRLYNACFGPHRTRQVEAFVRAVCHQLLDEIGADDEPDLHARYAMPIPGRVMAHIMGLPADAADLFMEWSGDGTLMTRPATPGIAPGGPPICAFFTEQLARQRALPEPTNHVFGVLIGARVDGRPLTDAEIVTQLHFMVMAGVHTTRGLLTHVVERLVRSPELFRELRDAPSLVPAFVEESLRHDAPVQRTTRRCTRDTAIGGVPLHAGDVVEVGIASGNRDDAVYDDPETFRLDRPEPRDHLGFGEGAHVCPGATLARSEAVAAVEVLLERATALSEVPGFAYPPVPGNLGHRPVPARITWSDGTRERAHPPLGASTTDRS